MADAKDELRKEMQRAITGAAKSAVLGDDEETRAKRKRWVAIGAVAGWRRRRASKRPPAVIPVRPSMATALRRWRMITRAATVASGSAALVSAFVSDALAAALASAMLGRA